MRTSEQINDLSAAFAKAQCEFHNPGKDREVSVKTKDGGTYTFEYATFGQIVAHVRPILGANGLSFVQLTVANGDNFDLRTRLMHSSGQWLESDTPVIWAGGNAQAFGSGITYAKRYALSAMMGLAADEEDDDGNAASGNDAQFNRRPAPQQQRPAPTATNGNGRQPDQISPQYQGFRAQCEGLFASLGAWETIDDLGREAMAIAEHVGLDVKTWRKAATVEQLNRVFQTLKADAAAREMPTGTI